MLEKTVKVYGNLYNSTQISKGNSKAWESIMKSVDGIFKDEPDLDRLNLDFNGIIISEPCVNNSFIDFITNRPKVKLIIYNDETTVNEINALLLTCDNIKEDIATNIQREYIDKQAIYKHKKKIENILKCVVYEGDKAIFNLSELYSEITNSNTITLLKEAVLECGKKSVVLNTDAIVIQDKVCRIFSDILIELEKEGIECCINSKYKDTLGKISTFKICGAGSEYKTTKKIEIIHKEIKAGRVGILTEFRPNKESDVFGRRGGGEVLRVSVAIYKGIRGSGEDVKVCFEVFGTNRFYTKEHASLEFWNKDTEYLNLTSAEKEIPIDEIGIYTYWLGTQYQFTEPIQWELRDSRVYYDIEKDDDGEEFVVENTTTLPRFIKLVLDSRGIKYDKESLNEAINKNDEILSEIRKKRD